MAERRSPALEVRAQMRQIMRHSCHSDRARLKHPRLHRLDRISCKFDSLLTTQQLQQDEHPLVRT